MAQKFINITPNILIEWNYSTGAVSETYSILTNVKTGRKNFISTSSKNDIDHTLFNVDPVINKFTKIDTSKYNFLQSQNFFTSPVQYDTIKIHFPTDYDFDNYLGFVMTIYAYDYDNKNLYYFSDFFFDKTDLYSEKSMNLEIPFLYGEKEWNKNITLSIPSIEDVSNQRQVTKTRNIPIPFSINNNITEKGLSQTAPIRIDFSYITGKETVFGNTYYYIGDILQKSIPKVPEYQALGLMVRESPDWDFFEIYGYYKNSNEGLDNFVYELESKGLKVRIEYVVTLYEENVQSGYPIKYTVTENFAQKIEFRPVFKYSNTTAAIDVQMDIVNMTDESRIIRRSTLGLTSNLFKYGKKLTQFNVSNVTKPKIYNYKQNNASSITSGNENTSYVVTKVPYPVLIETFKILVNSSNALTNVPNEFKTNGLLNLIFSPYDNIVKFQLFEQKNNNSTPEPFNLTNILNNGKLLLTFRSDTEVLEKNVLYDTGENDFDNGVVVFKVNETDMTILKRIIKDKKDNFYLILQGNKTKTQLYSGKVKLFEDLKFIDYAGSSWKPYTPSLSSGSTTPTGGESVMPSDANTRTAVDKMSVKMDIHNPRLESNMADVQKIVKPAGQSAAEIFQSNYQSRVSQYSNYLLLVNSSSGRPGATEVTNLNIFKDVVDDIKQNKGQYGIAPKNVYYYDNVKSIIILQGVKKNNDFITTPTMLNSKILSVVELKMDLGFDAAAMNEYQGNNPNMGNLQADFKVVLHGQQNSISSIKLSTNKYIDLIDLSNTSDGAVYEWSILNTSNNQYNVISTSRSINNLDASNSLYLGYAGLSFVYTFKLKIVDLNTTSEKTKNLSIIVM